MKVEALVSFVTRNDACANDDAIMRAAWRKGS